MKNEEEAEYLNWNGTTYRTILTTKASGGAIAIVDSVSPPQSGPPRHIHKCEDEIFVILSGEVELWVAGKVSHLGPGETAFIMRGTEHTFRAVGVKPCRHLVILTPGGFEGFFAEMAEANAKIPENMDVVIECAKRHNLEFTGPPLSDHMEAAS